MKEYSDIQDRATCFNIIPDGEGKFSLTKKGISRLNNLSLVDLQEIKELCTLTLSFDSETITRAFAIVTGVFDVTKKDMRGLSRKGVLPIARQTFFFLISKIEYISCEKAGAILNRDHSTYLYSIGKTEQLLESVNDRYYTRVCKCCELAGIDINKFKKKKENNAKI